MRRTLRRVYRLTLVTLAMVSVAGVILASLAFTVLQNLDSYRDDLALRVGEMLGKPVAIGAAEVFWQGAMPILRLENLTIGKDSASALSFRAAELRIDPIESARRRTLATAGVRILGAQLRVARTESGQLEMLGFGDVSGDAPFDIDAAQSLLVGPARLTLANAVLIYHPLGRTRPPVKLAMDVGVQRDGDVQTVSGALRLPGRSQSYVTADGTVALDSSGGWRLDVRVRAMGLLGRDVRRVLPQAPLPGEESFADVDVQVRTAAGAPIEVDGRLSAKALTWVPADALGGPASAAANVRLSVDSNGWRAELREVKVQGALTPWSAARASLAYQFGTDDTRPSYSATLSNGRLEDLLAVAVFLTPRDEALRALRQPRATGTVIDATVAWVDEPGEQVPFDVSANVEDLSWPAKGNQVGVSGINGSVWLTHTGGRLKLDTTAGLVFSAPSVLRQPLPFDSAVGELDIEIAPPNLTVSTAGVQLTGPVLPIELSGEVVRDGRDDLLLDVEISSSGFDVAAVQALLPSPRLPADLNEWLTGSLQGGRVGKVAVRLLGRDSAIVAQPDSDSIRVALAYEGVTVDYEPGWPALTDMRGSLSLRDGKLTVESTGHKVGGVAGTMTAIIEDISADDPTLEVDTSMSGPGRELLGMLASTPSVNEAAARRLRATPLSGPLKVDARIIEGLESDREEVRATVKLAGNAIAAMDGLPPLDEIAGTIDYRNGVLKTEKLSVRVASERTTLVGSIDLNAGPSGRIELRTQVPHQFWVDLVRDLTGAEREAPAWLARLSGRSSWTLALDLAADTPPSVALSSDLQGIAIDLPPPVGKAADTPRPFQLSRAIDEDAALRVSYGDVLSGLYRPDANAPDDFDLAVRIGPGEPPPLSPGRWVARGRLEAFDTATLELDLEDDDRLDLTRLDLDVVVGAVSLGGAMFQDVRLRMRPEAGREPRVMLEADQIAGVLVVPADPNAPLGVNLDRLDIPEFTRSDDVPDVDPRSLPAMSFSVKSVTYAGRNLGATKFVALKSPTGIAIDKIYIIAEDFDAQGAASWTLEGGRHVTRLTATLNANTLGALFREVGYSANVASGGATQMVLDAVWSVPPLAASLSNMTGDLEFQAGAGRFEEVSAGPGAQLFGLLNLRVLPQLLTLDLGALFQKGLEFDNIYGRFQIDGGQAYTNDLTLNSPTAKVSFAGRTGIATQDYDQVATVIPALTGSLPAAGAAFGVVGAGVGAAIWLMEQVMDGEVVDKVAAFQYSLKGTWDDPRFERIVVETTEEESSER